MDGVFKSLRNIRGTSYIYLYTPEIHFKVLEQFPYNSPFRNRLEVWLNDTAMEDIAKLFNEKNLGKDNFQAIYDKASEIRSTIFVPYEKGKEFDHISLLFFLSKIDKIKKLVSDLEQIYSDCDEDLKTERVLIEKDLMGRNISSDFIEIENPFEMIPTLIDNLKNLLQIFESVKESINMDSFSYKGQFQILSSFISDIQDKDLEEEEINDLTNIWNCLMFKGFILIKLKLN